MELFERLAGEGTMSLANMRNNLLKTEATGDFTTEELELIIRLAERFIETKTSVANYARDNEPDQFELQYGYAQLGASIRAKAQSKLA